MKEIVPRESHSRVRVEIIRAIMVSGSCLESRFRTRNDHAPPCECQSQRRENDRASFITVESDIKVPRTIRLAYLARITR